jgi:hypothetical protein
MLRATTDPRGAMETLRFLIASGGLTQKMVDRIYRLMRNIHLDMRLRETHHYLPQQFRDWFSRKGINIDDYLVSINSEWHRIIHGKFASYSINFAGHKREAFFRYNSAWMEFIENNPNATRQQIIDFANLLAKQFGLPPIP